MIEAYFIGGSLDLTKKNVAEGTNHIKATIEKENRYIDLEYDQEGNVTIETETYIKVNEIRHPSRPNWKVYIYICKG